MICIKIKDLIDYLRISNKVDFNIREILYSDESNILEIYGSVSNAFEVSKKYEVKLSNNDGISLNMISVDSYIKDYDIDERPLKWAEMWDLKNWGFLFAYSSSQLIGGAIVAWNTHGINMLENRVDLAVLWDIRISHEFRGIGLGTKIFQSVVEWARDRNCTELKIETQNNNVGACKFYSKMGCKLIGVNKNAYPDLDEIQFIFNKNLLS